MDSSAGDDEAALSDFEEDVLEPSAVVLPAAVGPAPAQNKIADSLRITLAELEDERQARKDVETAKADAEAQVARLKTLIHEAVRQRDEAVRIKEERSKQLEEVIQLKDDVTKKREEIGHQRDELQKQKDDLGRARDSAKSEIEGVARILVTQAEKVTSMSKSIKAFSGGLPRVPKSTGLAAIALGFAKRVEEIIEEGIRQREDAFRQKNDIHNQMDQRNFTIAIEVSQLEASNKQLENEVGKISSELERWQKVAEEKDARILDVEGLVTERSSELAANKQEVVILRQTIEESNSRMQELTLEREQNIESSRRAKASLMDILGVIHAELTSVPLQTGEASPDVHQEDETTRSPAYGEEISALAGKVVALWNENRLRAEKERKDFESTVRLLHAEKGNILQKLSFPEENGSQRECGPTSAEETTVSDHEDGVLTHEENANGVVPDNAGRFDISGEGPQKAFLKLMQAELAAQEKRNEQISSQVSILEQDNEVLQQELRSAASTFREEIDRLQRQAAIQARDLGGKNRNLLELNNNFEELTADLLAAEEEVVRWKDAATAEAAAGAGIMEEVEARNKEIAALNEKVDKFRELMEEAKSKVGSKEDMALAAVAALNAAERSRQIADERAADLRFRIDEMNRQLEELEQRNEHRGCNLFDTCWPWFRWRSNRAEDSGQLAAEMEELLEPLVLNRGMVVRNQISPEYEQHAIVALHLASSVAITLTPNSLIQFMPIHSEQRTEPPFLAQEPYEDLRCILLCPTGKGTADVYEQKISERAPGIVFAHDYDHELLAPVWAKDLPLGHYHFVLC